MSSSFVFPLRQATDAEELVTSAQLKIAAAYMCLSYDGSSGGMKTFFAIGRVKQSEIARTIKLTVDDLLDMMPDTPGGGSDMTQVSMHIS